jgi:hypothetical protein
MEAKKKFKLKRQTKLLMQIGYACLIFFAVFLITTIIVRIYSDGDWTKLSIIIPILTGLLGSLMTSGILLIVAGWCQNELLTYKRNIQVYRARKFALNTLQHLQNNELQLAINEYIKCEWYPEKSLDDYVYGMLIMACYHSGDEKLRKQGINRINKIREQFDPKTFDFN